MKKLIIPSLLAIALLSFVGCASDKGEATHSTTSTSQETTVRSPVTTTTTDTTTK